MASNVFSRWKHAFARPLRMDDEALSAIFDEEFYLACYPKIRLSGMTPMAHFRANGSQEFLLPNPYFDLGWYIARYPDVLESGLHPLDHYMQIGAAGLRNPHPDFHAAFYIDRHPEAAANPLVHYLHYGQSLELPMQPGFHLPDYLPSQAAPPDAPPGVMVDIVIPVYRGLAETRRCLASVLADAQRPPGRLIVINDASPEPAVSAYLRSLARARRITLIHNKTNLGFVRSANLGMEQAAPHDVALLNADTEVPEGWLRRLAGHAYTGARIASVSPFSNNATICSYPTQPSATPALGLSTAQIDAACQAANAGRSLDIPVTVGFAMYIRRAALDEVGLFDAETFARGYGEECDFCLRASDLGWVHRLACDTYVHHEGKVSFGEETSEEADAQALLLERYPDYEQLILRHAMVDDANPARWAISAALFRDSGLPIILLVSHGLGGGVRRHIEQLVASCRQQANFLLLEGHKDHAMLSLPALPGHAGLRITEQTITLAVDFLRTAPITRVHIHHTLGFPFSLRDLITRLKVPFDLTIHDWFLICPRVNLIAKNSKSYCGEPGTAACNACIAPDTPDDLSPHGATDITLWRNGFHWLFQEADRVLCPSADVLARLRRHGLAKRAMLAPHEAHAGKTWTLSPRQRPKRAKLRIAVLGVMAPHKGQAALLDVLRRASRDAFSWHLIGYPSEELPDWADERMAITGHYQADALPGLIDSAEPDIIWFPSPWPETYSYTLTAALAAGLPIVATDIGAFTERLAGRPMTWLVAPDASAEEWLDVFDALRAEIDAGKPPVLRPRPPVRDFYGNDFIVASTVKPTAHASTLVDMRSPGRMAVVLVPETNAIGGLSPCAYIRLLQPLDHLAEIDLVIAKPDEALRYRADLIVTQRYAVLEEAAAQALVRHAKSSAARLVYDIDDDLTDIPADHPEADILRPRAERVAFLLRQADAVLASTPGLQQKLSRFRDDIIVLPNALDERLWSAAPPPHRGDPETIRLLLMGTSTHDQDFALIRPALEQLRKDFGRRISIDIIGMLTGKPPRGVSRIGVPGFAGASYPGFVDWLCRQPPWHIGLIPLADTDFNAAKSAIKALDYAALGLAVLASDVPAYRGSLADGRGGQLVANTPQAWYKAIAALIERPLRRQDLAAKGRATFLTEATLSAQAETRLRQWRSLVRRQEAAQVLERPARRPSVTWRNK